MSAHYMEKDFDRWNRHKKNVNAAPIGPSITPVKFGGAPLASTLATSLTTLARNTIALCS